MANLGALANVPFLGGYLAQEEYTRNAGAEQQQATARNLAMLAQMQQMRTASDTALETAAQRQREASFRTSLASLGQDATDEQIANLGLRAGVLNAKDAVTIAQGAANKKAALLSSQQMALARLAQDYTFKMENLKVAQRNATTSEQKLALADYANRLNAWRTQSAMAIQSGRLAYETGTQPFMPDMPTPTTPTTPGATAPLAGVQQPVMRQDMTNEDDARNTALNLASQGVPFAIRGPEPLPAAAPVAAPAPTEPPPVTDTNMDPRDFKARGAIPPTAPTANPVATPAPATPNADMGAQLDALKQQDWFKRMPPKAQNEWITKYTLQQTKPSIAGQGTFTPQALEFVAKQYLRGDRQAVQGFARSATARIALQEAIVAEAAKQGLTPEETASRMAEYAGITAGSRTVGQRAANISLAATEAGEMMGIVKEASDAFARTNFVPWNMALKAYESGTGSPEVAAFGASVNALVNVYARAINPTGQPTVSDKEHARAIINTVQSPQQVEAVLGIMKREMEIAKSAPGQVRQGIRSEITGQTSGDVKSLSNDELLRRLKGK